MGSNIRWSAEPELMDRREFERTDVWLQRLQSSHRRRFTVQRKQRREFKLTGVWLQRLQTSYRHWFTVQRKQRLSWPYTLRSSVHI